MRILFLLVLLLPACTSQAPVIEEIECPASEEYAELANLYLHMAGQTETMTSQLVAMTLYDLTNRAAVEELEKCKRILND